MDRYAWIPEHQQHAAYSLAHADNLIERAGRLVLEHTRKGTVTLDDVVSGTTVALTVTGVAPLPQAVARLTSDALNQLRSTLEHVLYAEVEHRVEVPLTNEQARSLEIPATLAADKLRDWATRKPRKEIAVLQPETDLYRRIAHLQPFQRRDSDAHPLKVLAEYTNHSKHRAPAVAAVQVGATIPDQPSDGFQVVEPPGHPIQVGDILARGPVGRISTGSLFPKVSILRPHSRTWHILIHELRDLESWVRRIALPMLITGTTEVDPLPPHLDITVGHADFGTALAAADPVPAADRLDEILKAGIAREALPDLLRTHPDGAQHGQALSAWAASLSDDEAVQKLERLKNCDPRTLNTVVRTMIDEALKV
ncbi:hypothetical protein [Actinomadura rayongensis]|uniref:Uncharacterized protein n=1 Tax=Actinomadura rayongensis TaxID=1429076 RepID=A0A6I4W7N2_9ACTN|nr:hypothetical protein [Actinomadura rayongensis]MXQ65618.1 hypothetical protein [Actinomadura rayongensis]